MNIDFHTHAFPDAVAGRAIETLQALADWRAVGDGTTSDLLRSMDRANIDTSAVCAIATKPGQVKGILQWQQTIRSDRIVPFCSVHPKNENPGKWIERIAAEGIPAIKLHPMYQDFVIDDEAMFDIYAAAAEHNLLVTLHCGRDIGFMDDPRPDRASPARVANVLNRLPGLRILCTHMGGWKMWDQVRESLIGRDVYLETSFCMPFMPKEQFVEMIRDHGTEKVCFGTDWPWSDQLAGRKNLEELGWDDETLRNLLGRNAAKLLP